MAFIEMDFASGGGGSLNTYATLELSTSEETLKGKAITISLEDTNTTPYVVNSSFGTTKTSGNYTASAKVQSLGTYNVQCDTAISTPKVTDFTSYNVSMALAPADLNDASWSLIRTLTSSGTFGNFYNVGDTKTITLSSGESVVMKVASINDGSGSAGAYYPNNTIDFISVDCMQTGYPMNATQTNVGGWNSCALRTTLNNTIFGTLPTDLQSAIIEKVHYRSSGNGGTTLVSSSDKLWTPTEWEIYGSISYSASTENADYNNKYSIFTDATSRIKHFGTSGSACTWVNSSAYKGNSQYWCSTSANGSVSYEQAITNGGVPICFRIG